MEEFNGYDSFIFYRGWAETAKGFAEDFGEDFAKEMIWAYISVVLGYDYMFDNSSHERWINRYLTDLYDEVDPVEEFVYRAVEYANNYN